MAKRLGLWSRLLSWVVRSTVANPQEWLVEWLGAGGRTATGFNINEVTALNFATVFAGVKLLSRGGGIPAPDRL